MKHHGRRRGAFFAVAPLIKKRSHDATGRSGKGVQAAGGGNPQNGERETETRLREAPEKTPGETLIFREVKIICGKR